MEHIPTRTSKIVNQPPLNGEHFHFITAVWADTLIQHRRLVLFFASAENAHFQYLPVLDKKIGL
jgi:hypothetical protein